MTLNMHTIYVYKVVYFAIQCKTLKKDNTIYSPINLKCFIIFVRKLQSDNGYNTFNKNFENSFYE